MQQSAAAVCPGSLRLRGLRCPPPYALRPRLAARLGPDWEASPWSERPAWTWHSPRSLRQPSLTEGIFFFPFPFSSARHLPKGTAGGRAAREGARGVPRVAPAPLRADRRGAGQAGPGHLTSLASGASGGVAWGAAAAFAELWPGRRL